MKSAEKDNDVTVRDRLLRDGPQSKIENGNNINQIGVLLPKASNESGPAKTLWSDEQGNATLKRAA
jgi:hypothetical protein